MLTAGGKDLRAAVESGTQQQAHGLLRGYIKRLGPEGTTAFSRRDGEGGSAAPRGQCVFAPSPSHHPTPLRAEPSAYSDGAIEAPLCTRSLTPASRTLLFYPNGATATQRAARFVVAPRECLYVPLAFS